jgi:hypothetical protein
MKAAVKGKDTKGVQFSGLRKTRSMRATDPITLAAEVTRAPPPNPSKTASETTASASTTVKSATTMPSSTAAVDPKADTNTSPVYFWKPTQGNGYLGQWFWTPFVVDGEEYKTAEMWMMVQKARLFGDEAVAEEMLATTDPKKHKALGRAVRNFEQKVWDLRELPCRFSLMRTFSLTRGVEQTNQEL